MCVGVRHVRRRSRRFWKTKTTPILKQCQLPRHGIRTESIYLALNRRKLFVIRGREKLGLLIYFDERTSGGRFSSSTSSSGMTCCKSLRRRRLARHALIEDFRIAIAHLAKRRSCKEYPYSLLPEPVSCSFSFNLSFDPVSVSFSLSRLPFGSDDGLSLPETGKTGIGSSRLTKASAVYSSIIARCIRHQRF